ncbi:hypothetical protein C8255_13935 [filamentous cyanobacterium CCP3]|nr:hypothetical protein C8255_13935 [filamentous cyanobacterium CCP3]
MYKVRLTKGAAKVYRSAETSLARRIARAFEILEQTPRQHPNIKALKGDLAGRYRYRVGDYRVVYRIDDDTAEVAILLIKHRRDAYDYPILCPPPQISAFEETRVLTSPTLLKRCHNIGTLGAYPLALLE